MTRIKELTDFELIGKMKFLVAEEKKNIAAQIVLLKEVRKRNLAIAMGYASLYEFCANELGLTQDQAWKRSQAAQAIEKEPEFFTMLQAGKVAPSILAVIAPKISQNTVKEIKEFIPGKTKREVEAFVSNLNPDGTRQPKAQTVKIVLHIDLKTHEKLKEVQKLLKQNREFVTEEDSVAAALDLFLERKDPKKKAERALKRQQRKTLNRLPRSRAKEKRKLYLQQLELTP